jgi:hypothetical protein
MIDRVVAEVPTADAPQCAQRSCCGNEPLGPSRRILIRSFGLLTVAALPTWVAAHHRHRISL